MDTIALGLGCVSMQIFNGNVIQDLAPHLLHSQTVSISRSQTLPGLCHNRETQMSPFPAVPNLLPGLCSPARSPEQNRTMAVSHQQRKSHQDISHVHQPKTSTCSLLKITLKPGRCSRTLALVCCGHTKQKVSFCKPTCSVYSEFNGLVPRLWAL